MSPSKQIEVDSSESRIRKLATRCGYRVLKSRKAISADNLGDYMLVDARGNFLVIGPRFDASLDEIEQYLGVEEADSDHSAFMIRS